MKKVSVIAAGVVLAAGCSFLAGCGSERVCSSEIETAYGKTMYSTVELYRKVQETVGKYVALPEDSRAIEDGKNGLEEIGKLLPSDLSELKRTVTGSRGIEEEITLQQELDEISGEYREIMSENAPDLERLDGIEGVEVKDGIIYLSNGQIVQADTPEGIAMAEYLISADETGSGEEYMKKIQKETEMLAESAAEDDSRGLYYSGFAFGYGQRWTDGVVNYRFGSTLTELHRKALTDAMNSWTESTEGKIRFAEFEDNGWNNFLLAIGASHVQIYETKDLSAYKASGMTTNIGMGYFGKLYIDDDLIYNTSTLKRVSLHELGHAIGLCHEHQRWDRDSYIKVSVSEITLENFEEGLQSVVNYGKIPHYLGGLVWKIQAVRVGWFTVYLPVLVWDENAVQLTSGSDSFDFNSVMLYPGFELADQNAADISTYVTKWDESGSSRKVTKTNYNLSKKDIQTVMSMY